MTPTFPSSTMSRWEVTIFCDNQNQMKSLCTWGINTDWPSTIYFRVLSTHFPQRLLNTDTLSNVIHKICYVFVYRTSTYPEGKHFFNSTVTVTSHTSLVFFENKSKVGLYRDLEYKQNLKIILLTQISNKHATDTVHRMKFSAFPDKHTIILQTVGTVIKLYKSFSIDFIVYRGIFIVQSATADGCRSIYS